MPSLIMGKIVSNRHLYIYNVIQTSCRHLLCHGGDLADWEQPKYYQSLQSLQSSLKNRNEYQCKSDLQTNLLPSRAATSLGGRRNWKKSILPLERTSSPSWSIIPVPSAKKGDVIVNFYFVFFVITYGVQMDLDLKICTFFNSSVISAASSPMVPP